MASVFYRAHHSRIINLSFISCYHRGDGGYVTLSDDSTTGLVPDELLSKHRLSLVSLG